MFRLEGFGSCRHLLMICLQSPTTVSGNSWTKLSMPPSRDIDVFHLPNSITCEVGLGDSEIFGNLEIGPFQYKTNALATFNHLIIDFIMMIKHGIDD